MSHILRAAALLVAAQILYGCASTPPTPHQQSLIACRAREVLYCSANGSRSAGDVCVCLTQGAAKAAVDNL